MVLDYSYGVTGIEVTVHRNYDNPMTERLNVCEDFQRKPEKYFYLIALHFNELINKFKS